ncbi:phage-associated protein, BcepMu gp16 family [Kiritimatiella glycovorans]|uniref:Phage-associated protein, BcepMu gp16 family n=2 Tax=Kiritimatiella glycovorans TaxID=1307763 RepID=A0A0G3EGT5_9BACT|nr:phage-associated protein, BcepMu gp16 family [Kiritimatiella glycovorans]
MPSPAAVKAFFVSRGGSLRQWALARGYSPSTVFMALRGERDGPRSRDVRRLLLEEMGLDGGEGEGHGDTGLRQNE